MSIFFEGTSYHIFNIDCIQKPNAFIESTKSDRITNLEVYNKNIHNFQTTGNICLLLVPSLVSNQSWNQEFERSEKKPALDKSIKDQHFISIERMRK